MKEPFTIQSDYNPISGILVLPDTADKVPCVILSHGLISSKESTKYVALSGVYEKAGIATCRFDFHGCGESGGKLDETSLTIRVNNLDSIMEYILAHRSIDPRRIGLLGSSFGGSTSIIQAAKDERVRCSSFWATPYRLDEKEDEPIDGVSFQKTIYTDFAQYDLLKLSEKISRALVIHGDIDETVPCEHGLAIFERLQTPKKCEIIKGGDHVLSDLTHRDHAIRISLEWFQKYLG